MEILKTFENSRDLQDYLWEDNYYGNKYDLVGKIVPEIREEKVESIEDIPLGNYKFKIEKAEFRYARMIIEDYSGNKIETYYLKDILTRKP